MLIARVGVERFAFDVAHLDEAVDGATMERVPHLPRGAIGVIRWRGASHTVWSPATALRATPVAPQTVLFLRGADRPVAIAVDDAEDLITLPHERVQRMQGIDDGAGLVLGSFQTESAFATVIDAAVLAASVARAEAP
jgi:chemotaxis signal transduction protein